MTVSCTITRGQHSPHSTLPTKHQLISLSSSFQSQSSGVSTSTFHILSSQGSNSSSCLRAGCNCVKCCSILTRYSNLLQPDANFNLVWLPQWPLVCLWNIRHYTGCTDSVFCILYIRHYTAALTVYSLQIVISARFSVQSSSLASYSATVPSHQLQPHCDGWRCEIYHLYTGWHSTHL